MIDFKVWFLVKGGVITAWVLYALGSILIGLASWRNCKYLFWGGLILYFVGTAIIIQQLLPFNWVVTDHVGGVYR